jgi:hypothetical protein
MAFTFKLEHPDGAPADPPTLRSAVPNWRSATRSRSVPVSRRCSSWDSERERTNTHGSSRRGNGGVASTAGSPQASAVRRAGTPTLPHRYNAGHPPRDSRGGNER